MGYNAPKQTVSQFQLKGRYAPDSICPLPGSPVRTSYYICLDPVCMIPRLRTWRVPPYQAGTGHHHHRECKDRQAQISERGYQV